MSNNIKKYIILTNLLFACFLKAQDFPIEIEKYPFVNYNINKVSFFSDSIEFYGFYRKLDKLISQGSGKINILHFGGSHVQADIWTSQMRDNFNWFLNQKVAARGWVYPFKMGISKNNNPSNYQFDFNGKWDGCRAVNTSCIGDIGMNALQTVTYDSNARFSLTSYSSSNIQYAFDRVKVFYLQHHQSFEVDLDSNYVAKQIIVNQQQGYVEFIFDKMMTNVGFKLVKKDTLQNSFTLFGLFCDLDAPGINYNAIGANGASVPTFLKCLSMEQQIRAIQPDLVVFSVGINDAFAPGFCPSCYENNYNEWIKIIKRASPNTAILFTTNTDSYKRTKKGKYYQNQTGLDVKMAMENLSRKHRAGVWDLFSVMGGLGSMEFWVRQNLAAKDRVHLSGLGYKFLGNLMFNALICNYEAYLRTPISRIKHD
ncbi:MAG: GDSL-type esterase/lipase family protein [Bacteroidota bacterium]|nr:GDSL-type esterase/lipase family protein [Bacteroidota bacterium]